MNIFTKIIMTFGFVLTALPALALSPFDIQFPVAELGSCNSASECKVYCDEPSNGDACTDWALKNGFMQEDPRRQQDDREGDVSDETAREFLENNTGPGGCSTFEECDTFCSLPENGETCFAFAKEHNLISESEIQEIERHQEEIDERRGPGGCGSREECDNFCRQPDNGSICLDFAVTEGHMTLEEANQIKERIQRFENFRPGQDLEDFDSRVPRFPEPRDLEEPKINEEKALEAIEQFGGPGGCSTFEECDSFCSTPENDEICMAYALEHNLMDPREAEDLKRMLDLEGPNGCRGQECKVYCDEPEHNEECLAFAIENDLMSPEEIERNKKFMEISRNGGPGGCEGQRECDAFCSNPENGETCFAFAKEHNLMPESEIMMIEKDLNLMRSLRDRGGPGDCRGERECQSYCKDPDHIDECMNFAVDQGMMDPRQMEMIQKEMEHFRTFEDGFDRDFTRNDFGPTGLEDNNREFEPEDFDRFGPPNVFNDFRSEDSENFRQEDLEKFKDEFRDPESFINRFEGDREFDDFRSDDTKRMMEERGFVPSTLDDRNKDDYIFREPIEFERTSDIYFKDEFDRQYKQEFEQQFNTQYQDELLRKTEYFDSREQFGDYRTSDGLPPLVPNYYNQPPQDFTSFDRSAGSTEPTSSFGEPIRFENPLIPTDSIEEPISVIEFQRNNTSSTILYKLMQKIPIFKIFE